MVIDVDKEVAIQTGKASTLHAVALKNNDGLGFRSLAHVAQHRIGKRQWAVDQGNAVAEDDAGLFAHAAQNLAASQG